MRRVGVAALAAGLLLAGAPATAEPGGEEPLEDLTPPVLTITPPAGGVDGWYADSVSIDVRATDNHANASGIRSVLWATSGAQSGSGSFGSRVGTGSVTVVTGGVTTLDVEASDANDNQTFGQTTVGIDRFSPTVALPPGLHGAELVKGTTVAASYSCGDAHSGVVSCTGPVAAGQPVPTPTVGQHALTVTARDKVGRQSSSTASYTVVDNRFTFTTGPAVQGVLAPGELLTVPPVVVSPTPTQVTYTWLVNGSVVAVGSQYRLTVADGGGELRVLASARRAGVADGDLVSATYDIPAGTIDLAADPRIEGEARAGRTLSVVHGEASAPDTEFEYTWFRDGEEVQKAAAPHFGPGDDDIGARITARVTARAPGHATRSWEVTPGPVVLGRQLEVRGATTVTGVVRVGEVLTAQAPSITTPDPRLRATGVTIAYQWLRDGVPILGATGATYRLRTTDVARRIAVQVSGMAPGFETERRTGEAAQRVRAAPADVTARAKALGRGRVRLTVEVGGIPGAVATGEVIVRRGATVVGKQVLRNGRVVLTMKKQRPGKVVYRVVYAGATGIDGASTKVRVVVR